MIRTALKLLILPLIGLIITMIPLVPIIKSVTAPDIAEIKIPGSSTFEIKEPGNYTVWRKSVHVTLGSDSTFKVEEHELPEGMEVYIQRTSDKSTVPLEASLGSSLRVNSVHKTSLFRAELDPGHYELHGTTPHSPMTLIISKDTFTGKLFILALACMGIGITLIAIGLIYAVYVIIQKLSANPKKPQLNTPQ